MTPALIRLHNFEPDELSTSSFTRGVEAMQIQSALYSRSTAEASNNNGGGGMGENTIIFIVLGVVCLLVILIGFYLVSRPRAASNAGPNVPSLHLHSPTTHPSRPRCERNMSERWKIWKIWRHTNNTDPTTANTPTSQLSPAPAPITKPSRIARIARGGSRADPPIVSRPPPPRRATSLSVATSFPHSHITEEAMSDFRASAYDLDGDLETEMLHSARDDVWVGHPLAVEEGCGDVGMEETMEGQGNATPMVEGGVEGDAPTRLTAQWGGGDYGNLGACRSVASVSDGVEGDVPVIEVHAG